MTFFRRQSFVRFVDTDRSVRRQARSTCFNSVFFSDRFSRNLVVSRVPQVLLLSVSRLHRQGLSPLAPTPDILFHHGRDALVPVNETRVISCVVGRVLCVHANNSYNSYNAHFYRRPILYPYRHCIAARSARQNRVRNKTSSVLIQKRRQRRRLTGAFTNNNE